MSSGSAAKDETGSKKMTSRQIDVKYVGRSAAIFKLIMTLAKLYNNPAELAGMNHKKKGRPFTYTASLIAAIVEIRNQLHLSLRGCEGMCETSMGDSAPDYSNVHKFMAS